MLHIQEIVNTTSETITQNNSHFGEKEVVRLVAEAAPGRGINGDLVREIARGYLRSQEVVALQAVKHEKRYTTVEFLSTEERMMNQVLSLKDTASHPVQDSTIQEVLSTERFLTIKSEQRNALLHITQTPGSVQVVSGMAGTGKTYMLAAAKNIYEAEGYEVKGIALAGKAAQGLAEGAGIESTTIAKFLNDLQSGELSLSRKTIVICDEAGMVSTQKLATIVDAIAMAGAKLVLVGDARQLQPIEAGGAFRVLGEKLGEAELREITRQLEAWAREAVHYFAAGHAEAALKAYAEQGLVHVSTHRTGAISKILNHWKAGGGTQSPEEHLILASTRKDVET
jgi:ATP-dependent exoDNAse (exonuclease V) alpha subunit